MSSYQKLCAKFYDADKPMVNLDSNELDLYKQVFSLDDKLIEPMCGSGRLLIPLLQLGYDVDGLDNSKNMLENCKERAKYCQLHPNLYLEDMLSFTPTQAYQGVIIPLGSFQLLYPRENAFNALKKFNEWLNPDGKLVMDLFIPWESICKHPEEEIGESSISLSENERIHLVSKTKTNQYTQRSMSENIYTKYRGDEIIATEKEALDILWYYPYEMELILEKQGFHNISWSQRVINEHEHLTFVAEKRECHENNRK